MRRAIVLILTLLVAVSILLVISRPRSNTLPVTSTTSVNQPVSLVASKLIAEEIAKAIKANVYINGHLVAQEDPPAKNFYLIVVAALAEQPITMIQVDGQQQSFFPQFNRNPPQPAIAYGDGSIDDPATAVTLGDMKGTTTDCAPVWIYNQDSHIFNVTIACYIEYTGNITEIGLLLNNLLIFYTHLDTPVEVSGNTTISYNLVIPVKTGNIYIPGLASWITWAITHDSKGLAYLWGLYHPENFLYFEENNPGYILDISNIYYAFEIDPTDKPAGCITPHYRINERVAYIDVVLCSGNPTQYNALVLYYRVKYLVNFYGNRYINIPMIAILFTSPVTWSGPTDTLFVTITVRW